MKTALLLVALAAAASAGETASPLNVPVIVQQKDGCGAAAIAMVIRYWRGQVPALEANDDPQRIMKQLYVPALHGIRGEDMARYFREQAFRAFVIKGDESDLEHHVSRGRPLIVCLRGDGSGANHYVVVVGSGREGVTFVDPESGLVVTQPPRTFLSEWARTGNWTLLAVPKVVQ